MAIKQRETYQQAPWLANVRTDDGLFAVDLEQRITHWSPAAERLLGYTAQEAEGLPCHVIIGGRDGRNHRFCREDCPIMVNARRGRPTPNYDLYVQGKDGSDAWINASILVLRGNRQESSVVVHVFRDVTHRRRVEEAALKAMATLRQFLTKDESPGWSETEFAPPPTPRLSRRELEVLRLLAHGLNTPQIAESLGVRPITTRNHIANLLTKLGVKNRLQAVLYASQNHIV